MKAYGYGYSPIFRRSGSLGLTIATAHYNRVIAAGGVVPAGISGLSSILNSVIAAYSITDSTDFNTKVPVFADAHYTGYKLGAGSGATLGQAAQYVYAINSSADFSQATAASQPLLLAHSGVNYLWCPGVDSNNCSTPSVSIDTTSGMSVEVQVSFTTNDDASNSSGWICANDNGGAVRSMFLGWSGSRTLILYWANLSRSATATAQIPAAYSGWIKVSLETSGADMLVKFLTSSDGSTWTQLGATITNSGGANTFQTSASPFSVSGNGTANNIAGKIFRVIYRNASGTARADFNPNSYNAATSQTQWTSTTGEVWTINTGTATTGYKCVVVHRTLVQFDGVDDGMQATLSGSGRFTQYLLSKQHGSIATNEGLAGPWGTAAAWRGALYTSGSKYATYQGSGADGVFGSTITKNIYYAIGVVNSSTGTDWIPNVNGTDVSNGSINIGTSSAFTTINLGSRQGGTTFSNSTINTYIMSSAADNSTQRTAMYNVCKTMNNL